jgi:hypothetical protein
MLSTPISLVLIMVIWVTSANTHDLLIPKKSAITAVIGHFWLLPLKQLCLVQQLVFLLNLCFQLQNA